jgi:RND family efflux transporter MFP subunit
MFQQVMPMFGGGQMVPQSAQQNSYTGRSQARTDYERQMAGLVAAQSKVDAIEAQLRERRTIAPYAAIILAKYVNLGDVVQPGQSLLDLAQTDQLDLKLEVPTRMVMELRMGESVPVILERNVTVNAVVEQINPAANNMQHTVTVKLRLPPNAPAAPGMYASALLAEPAVAGEVVNTPVVPSSSLVYRGSLPAVFVVGMSGKLELRVIRVGDIQGDRVVVLSGVAAGEKVVTQPSKTMRSGDSVYDKAR